MLAVVAVGGNALGEPQEPLPWPQQVRRASNLARRLVSLIVEGHRLVITHGNGPQVGAILLQNERGAPAVPPNPVDVCVAHTQAHLGYALQLGFERAVREARLDLTALPVVTLVVVDPDDPAFSNPSKPVGSLYRNDQVPDLQKAGWTLREDSRGGYRRVVPSPRPLEIVGAGKLRSLLSADGIIPIVVGGGGVPVVRDARGLRGIEAVVDKDLASSLLATTIGADCLVILTDVPCAFLNFRTDAQEAISTISMETAETHLAEGQFPAGSMGPKVQAAVDFVRSGGGRSIITDPGRMGDALLGEAGTHVVADTRDRR